MSGPWSVARPCRERRVPERLRRPRTYRASRSRTPTSESVTWRCGSRVGGAYVMRWMAGCLTWRSASAHTDRRSGEGLVAVWHDPVRTLCQATAALAAPNHRLVPSGADYAATVTDFEPRRGRRARLLRPLRELPTHVIRAEPRCGPLVSARN